MVRVGFRGKFEHDTASLRHVCKHKGEVVCGQVWWPILRICALHLTHPSVHTVENIHLEQCMEQCTQCCGARGALGGSVPCSRVSPQSWHWGWKEYWLFTPPTYNPCQTWDSNPRPSGYKSNSLSIRPRLPLKKLSRLVDYLMWGSCWWRIIYSLFSTNINNPERIMCLWNTCEWN